MKHPANLAYLFPSIPPASLARQFRKYHAEKMEGLAHQLLHITGCLGLPREALSAHMRLKLSDHRFRIGAKVYYALRPEDFTPNLARRWGDSVGLVRREGGEG
jgi:hypothetical protein